MAIRNVILAALLATATVNSQVTPQPERTPDRIGREARHQILMLPFFGVFDNIELQVNNCTVTLTGQVTRPLLRSEAENAVKGIEGVDEVVNRIEVLSLSAFDDNLRMALYRAIYGYAALQRYAMPAIKPIRIIVKNGHATLEGVVDSEADKNLVSLRANAVRDVFSVANHLRVAR